MANLKPLNHLVDIKPSTLKFAIGALDVCCGTLSCQLLRLLRLRLKALQLNPPSGGSANTGPAGPVHSRPKFFELSVVTH